MGNGHPRRPPHQGASLGGRRKRGAFAQAVGISRGGRTSKIADRGDDTKATRAAIAAQGAEAVIPTTASRKAPVTGGRATRRARNLVERLWCRLKDWRRIATRYDRLARNFLADAQVDAVSI